jgi:hypothetical protein
MDDWKYVRVECVTMGHEGCKKLLERRGNAWYATRIIHKVYGRTIKEEL